MKNRVASHNRHSAIEIRNYIFYKPYGVLCQFTGEPGQKTLADFGPFPKDVYPTGRLDADSEGLVLLTNDGRLKHLLMEPKYAHPRTYLVQVERIPTEESLERLRKGVVIEGKRTKPAEAAFVKFEVRSSNAEVTTKFELRTSNFGLAPRNPPIRFRKNVPTTWLEITLREGRNRQVRKMTAAIGHPTLRLVRIKIMDLTLEGLMEGESRELKQEEIERIYKKLRLPT